MTLFIVYFAIDVHSFLTGKAFNILLLLMFIVLTKAADNHGLQSDTRHSKRTTGIE